MTVTGMSRAYGLGVIVGRFQILHKGHGEVIRKGLELCDELAIFIGSSQESGTYKNPFDYETRKDMLTSVFPVDVKEGRLKIYPLPDIGVGNNCQWGAYVVQNVVDRFGKTADIFISGKEERRTSWFGDETAELYAPKSIDISATRIKEFLLEDDRSSWEKYIEPALADCFDEQKKIVCECRDKLETKSI